MSRSTLLLTAACLLTLSALSLTPAIGDDKPAASQPAATLSIKGTCTFNGKNSTWSAKLTPKGDGTYDAVYVSSWGGKPLDYVGTIKTDGKTQISGMGKASGRGANGTFEFAGKYGADGIAKCNYKEIGDRGRSGTLTAELPK